MKKIFTFLILAIFSAVQLQAQDNASMKKAGTSNIALIHFKEGDIYNFGTIKMGITAVHEFEFTNTGTLPLLISDCMASCGCTTPEWPKEPILPGKIGKIKVTFHTQGHPGEFTKNIFITSNALTDAPTYVLHITGNVTEDKEVKK
ncbi:MAG: DUF1573 domain-containing protein [Taibaiella sp.]|nr:DUF1573 domain-containing protein [Taibaiella sp.]